MSKPSSFRSGGFTLIEVLVALAILSVSLVAVMQTISVSIDRTQVAQRETVASFFAQSLIERIGGDVPLQPSDTHGDFGNGFRWRLHIEPSGDGDDKKAWSISAFRLVVSVFWDDGRRSLSFATLRLGPKANQ